MSRTYYGYTRNRAKANLDALWAAVAESACNSTAPIALPDEAAVMQPTYFGRSKFARVCDIDALWEMLPGVQPVWPPDHPTRVYRARASKIAYADLDALYAALAALDCCPPDVCRKILDESFSFATRADFLARWQAHSTLVSDLERADYDIFCDGDTTQVMVNAAQPDQIVGESYLTEFYSDAFTTPGRPVWMRFRCYFDVNPTPQWLDNGQQQIAFGGVFQPQAQDWFSFATDQYNGGKFYTGLNLQPPYSRDHNGVPYGHETGESGYAADPFPGPGVVGFESEDYYDGFATLWELVSHTQYDPHGIVRIRTFIGPINGPKVPMSDARILAPGMEAFAMRLTWVAHNHKNGGVHRAPKMKHVEAWECSYAANPCGVDIVVPDPTGEPVSLEIVAPLNGIELDDTEEIIEQIAVVARDAQGRIVPGVRPEFIPFNDIGADSFESGWGQGVSCGTAFEEFDVKAWYPNGGAGIESNAIHVKSIGYGAPRRYWKLKPDLPDRAPPLSLARLELREGFGGPDVSGAGTPFGTVPLAGTSLANAFDADPATIYTAGAGRPCEQEIGIDFGPGGQRYIAEIAITATAGAQGPIAWSMWSSMNGLVWMRHQPYSRKIWSAGASATFTVF